MLLVPAYEVLPTLGNLIPAQTKPSPLKLKRHVLLVHQQEPVASSQISEALAVHELLGGLRFLQALLLGELRVDPKPLLSHEVGHHRLVAGLRRGEDEFPAPIHRDLQCLSAGAAAHLKGEIIYGERRVHRMSFWWFFLASSTRRSATSGKRLKGRMF